MATRMFDRRPAAATADPHERVATIVARHGDLLLRVARHYALCADDAHDAVQRALEIYMRRVDSLDPATELAWLKVVVKHESLAVRRGRAGVASEDVDLDAVPAEAQRSVEERFESNERVERSAEVMRRLKRDEARALMLKAEGLSYNEIGERLGLDLHQGQPLHHRGQAPFHAPLRGARDGSRMRAPRPDAPGARHRAPRPASRCSSSARTCATAPAAAPRSAPSTPRTWAGCRPSRQRCSHRRGRSWSACEAAAARATPEAPVELHPMDHQEERRRALPPHQRRRVRGPADRALGGRGRRPPLNRPHQPPRLGRDRTPPPPELRPRDRRPRGQHRRRRPHHLHRRPDRDLRQRRRRRDLLRRDRAPPGPEAGDPERGEDREAQGDAKPVKFPGPPVRRGSRARGTVGRVSGSVQPSTPDSARRSPTPAKARKRRLQTSSPSRTARLQRASRARACNRNHVSVSVRRPVRSGGFETGSASQGSRAQTASSATELEGSFHHERRSNVRKSRPVAIGFDSPGRHSSLCSQCFRGDIRSPRLPASFGRPGPGSWLDDATGQRAWCHLSINCPGGAMTSQACRRATQRRAACSDSSFTAPAGTTIAGLRAARRRRDHDRDRSDLRPGTGCTANSAHSLAVMTIRRVLAIRATTAGRSTAAWLQPNLSPSGYHGCSRPLECEVTERDPVNRTVPTLRSIGSLSDWKISRLLRS